jgi:transcriptional regulator with XRE-family HTH domain
LAFGNPDFITDGGSIVTEREHDEMTIKLAIGRLVGQVRTSRGLSVREVAGKIGYAHSYIHDVETGKLASDVVMQKLDDLFDMKGSLMDLVYVARKGKVEEYGKKVAERECKAQRIQVFSSSTIPSLLQTEEYALASLRVHSPKSPSSDFADAVSERLARQKVFERADPPLYWVIIDEAALRRPVGGHCVMSDQLESILHFFERPQHTFQVIPFERGEYWMMGGMLTLVGSPNGTTLAYVESFESGEVVKASRRVVELTQKFDTLRGIALPEVESLEIVGDYLEKYR